MTLMAASGGIKGQDPQSISVSEHSGGGMEVREEGNSSDASAAPPQTTQQIQNNDLIASSMKLNPNGAPSTPISHSPTVDQPMISSPQIPLLNPSASDYPSKQQISPQSQGQQQPQKSHQVHLQQQQQQPHPAQQFQQQHQLQQLSMMGGSAGFQSRTASGLRIAQIQQQFGAAGAANIMRQHVGMYGQMNFGGSQQQKLLQQQQQQQQQLLQQQQQQQHQPSLSPPLQQLPHPQQQQQSQLQQQQQQQKQHNQQQQQFHHQQQQQQQQPQQQQEKRLQQQQQQQLQQMQQPQPSQQQQQIVSGISRAGMMPQAQIPVLAGQPSTTQFSLQSQVLAQSRQKNGLGQTSQFHPSNSSGQTFPGVQSIGMMSSLGHLRANGPLSVSQQRLQHGQMRQQQQQQQLLQQSPSSPQLGGQGLQRTSSLASMNVLSGLSQNGQPSSGMAQNSFTQQQPQWIRQMNPGMSSPGSPSYHIQPQQQPQQQRHQQAFLQQPFSTQMQQKIMSMSQQQISQLIQQQQQQQSQPQLSAQQNQPLPGNLAQQHQLQLLQQQQLSSRVLGSAGQQKLTSAGGLQPGDPVSTLSNPVRGAGQGADAENHLLGKRKIQDLVSQVDPLVKLDPEVEELLLEVADDFIHSVTSFACNIAKHRKSSTLEQKDLLLHLDKNWKLNIPGFSNEDQNKYHRKLVRSESISSLGRR